MLEIFVKLKFILAVFNMLSCNVRRFSEAQSYALRFQLLQDGEKELSLW